MIKSKKLSEILSSIETQDEIIDFLFVFSGQLNEDVVATAVKLIERKLKMEMHSPTTITRTKIISTEILQNITKHQMENKDLLPYYFLASTDKGLVIYAGNAISDSGKTEIEKQLGLYKSYPAEEMRKIYLNALSKSIVDSNGNAGLGLLDIAYRSGQKFNYNFSPAANNAYLFDLNVWITK